MAPETGGGEALLRLSGAEVRDGPLRLLAGIDFLLRAGQVIGLVGISGSGKTTLLHALAGTRELSAGRRELLSGPVSLFPQDAPAALNPSLTVARQLALLDRACVGAEAAARLEAAGLDDPWTVLRCRPGQLSGGECQRVVWAMVLLAGPRVLLLDEPTSALDAALRRASFELLLRYLRSARAGAVVASHDPALLLGRCTHLAVVDGGRIAASGPLPGICEVTDHPLIRALLAARAAPGCAP